MQINAFSPSPFGGNPAAVVYLPYMPADKWLQKVAAEFNLSETAYVVRRRQGPLQRSEDSRGVKAVGPKARRPLGNEFDLRWFTPSTEVHYLATLTPSLDEVGSLSHLDAVSCRVLSVDV